MRFIYSQDERRMTLPFPRPAAAGQAYGTITRTHTCTAFSFVGTSGPVTVEASDDEWSTTLFSQDFSADGDVFAVTGSSIAAASWRIRARGNAVIGSLYPGVLAETSINPSAPFAIEKLTLSEDQRGAGGMLVSEVRGSVYAGTLQFSVAPQQDVDSVWRPMLEATNNGRKAYVVENHITGSAHIVTSPSAEFPFSITDGGLYWSGSINVQGVP